MNNKGFAITTILYGTFLLFLMLMVTMLGILANYKDKMQILMEETNGARSKIEQYGNLLETKLSEIEVGDYIDYSVYYNGKTYNKWRVLSKSGSTIEIISAGVVYNVELKGNNGYRNAVKILNDEAGNFLNKNLGAKSARSLGSSEKGGVGSKCTNGSKSTIEENMISGSMTGYPVEDTCHESDLEKLKQRTDLIISNVWLASRSIEGNLSFSLGSTYGEVKYISSSKGDVGNFKLQAYYNACECGGYYPDWLGGGCVWYDLTKCNKYYMDNDDKTSKGFRPVITLQEASKILSGDGTSTNPYLLDYK